MSQTNETKSNVQNRVSNFLPHLHDRRNIKRLFDSSFFHPISFAINFGVEKIQLKIINYHFLGACLQCPDEKLELLKKSLMKEITLEFFLGNRMILDDLKSTVIWENLDQNKCFGVQFQSQFNQLKVISQREQRFTSNKRFPVTLVGKDPLDPHREIYLKVEDMSNSGIGLTTSLSNRNLFPGMVLKNFVLTIPGRAGVMIDALIRQTYPIEGEDTFFLGGSITSDNSAYKREVQNYISYFGGQQISSSSPGEGHVLASVSRQMKQGITYKMVETEQEYIEVLKLRYEAYLKHHKVADGKTWKDQGEGLNNEGVILGGYLGGKLICTVELRYGDKIGFRSEKYFDPAAFEGLDIKNTVEVNKMAVHPCAQGTDIVVGIIQKIHALSLIHGGYNFLLMSTDKLFKSYFFLGFRPIKYSMKARIDHPDVPSMRLNLLTMKREIYMKRGGRIHPKIWDKVYREVDRYMEELGVIVDRSQSEEGNVLASYQRKKESENIFINPKLTHQHMVATVIHPYILVADEMIGKEKVDTILQGIGIPRNYFLRQSNWVSSYCLDEFLDRFQQYGDLKEINRRAGFKGWDPDVLGASLYFLLHFFTPLSALRAFEKSVKTINHTRFFKLEEVDVDQRVKVRTGPIDRNILPKHPETCENWKAGLEGYLALVSGSECEVKKTSCCYHGDEDCLYEFTLPEEKKKPWRTLVIFLLGAGLCGLIQSLRQSLTSDFVFSFFTPVLSLVYLVFYFVKVKFQAKDHNEFIKRMQRIEEDTSKRYSELQKAKQLLDHRYEEAKILEDTSKHIQSADGLSIILNTTLKTICDKFNFDRAFVMLRNEDKTILKTVAISGIEGPTEDIWSFSVDIAKIRENPLVLSSVYHTGNPILIKDIETHLFQLNEKSQRLVKTLGTKGFVIVPIPAEDGNFGVIVADKVKSKTVLDYSHVILLQRFGQHLGLALDKHSKMEREKNLRLYFEKYVPSQIAEEALSASRPSLGGTTKTIVCMFLDIRDFTKLSGLFPPSIVLDLLNRIFGPLSEIIIKNGGFIDKFLGDGMLITWGSLANSSPDPIMALKSALEMINKLEELNKNFVGEGIPHIRIGMGIHMGPAIVGNIGSNERMEFTSIGSTVNLASRIEGLCKKHDTTFVISDELMQGLPESWLQLFTFVENESIRGLEKPVRIGVFKSKETMVKESMHKLMS